MEEAKIIYILYTSRGELIAALELYQVRYDATHALPEQAYGLNRSRGKELWLHYSYEPLYIPTDTVQGIPFLLPMSYQFRPL